MTYRDEREQQLPCFAIGDRIETTQTLHLVDRVIAARSCGLVVDLCGPLHVLVRMEGLRDGVRLSKRMLRLRV